MLEGCVGVLCVASVDGHGGRGRQADLLPILRYVVQFLMLLERGDQSLVSAAT